MADETPNEEDAPPVAAPPRRPLRRLLRWLVLLAVVLPVGCTAVYRVVPPPITLLMLQRMGEGRGLARDWVPIEAMSPALAWSVIAAEDARFCEHHGFEFEAMKKALENNEKRPNRIRGGSTVSQQTAKNVFLWPARSYLRKGLEAGFTVLIEALWGKRRIMEVYLNTVEWGPGVYGAQAAARHHFGVGADALSPQQAARLAAILPSPLKWRAANPGPYVSRRSGRIAAAAGTVRREGLADCLRLAGQPPAPRPRERREDRRRAAEEIMEQTAPPLLPGEEDAAPPPSGSAPAEPGAAEPPPLAVEPQPLELPPPLEVPPLPAEPPAAP